MRLKKFIRNTLISMGSLIILSVGAGVAYTWYNGQNPPVDTSAQSVAMETPTAPVMRHTQPAPNAPESAAVEAITSPVQPGSNASITVKTNPTSACTIAVTYNNVPSKDSGLSPKVADEYGIVSWTWTVESSVPVGKWPAKVTCVYNKKSAMVQADLQVAK
jgi:hypothetical protein